MSWFVVYLDDLITTFIDFLMWFWLVLFDDLFSGVWDLVELKLPTHSYPTPSSKEEILVMRVLSYLDSLDNKKFIVIFGQVRMSQSHSIELLILLQHSSFVPMEEIVVNGNGVDTVSDKAGLFVSWMILGFRLLRNGLQHWLFCLFAVF